jgi:MFS family permease
MDVHGRRAAAIPCFLLFGLGLLALGSAQTPMHLFAASALIGLGGGLSSGFNMTMAQDGAPAVGRSRYIGVYKVLSDSGQLVGPLLVGFISARSSLGAAAAAMGGACAFGIVLVLVAPWCAADGTKAARLL